LDATGKANLLEWILRGGLTVAEVPGEAGRDIERRVLDYADRDIDFADAALIRFAGVSGCRSIPTVDERDFGIYRARGNKRFDRVGWRNAP
jgi:predicted nucleic acid-binding protein